MDNSSLLLLETLHHTKGDLVTLLLCLLLGLLVLSSILGNSLVCLAVTTDPSLRKLSNLFLVSLAIADLLVAIFVMPWAIVNDMQGYWWLGHTACKLWISSDVMCSTASILNLCLISLDRYIRIKDPLQYTKWITRRSVPVMVCLVWITSALISFLPIMLDLHVSGVPVAKLPLQEEGQLQDCRLDFSLFYSVTSSCISFLGPCILMLAIYLKLWTIGRVHVNNIKASALLARNVEIRLQGCRLLTLTDTEVSSLGDVRCQPKEPARGKVNRQSSVVQPKQTAPRQISHSLMEEHKATITVGVIMGVFLLCWSPFFVINIVHGFCKDCVPGQVFKALTWLGYSNSAFNPLIYSIFNSEFREAFKRILFHRRR